MTKICPVCHGRGGPIEIECPDCGGSGFDPHEDNPFAQCHTCYGEGSIESDDCTRCGGIGEIDDDSFADQDEDEDEDEDEDQDEGDADD